MVPDIEIQIIFIGNFNDAQKAYDLTRTAIENGANVVYNVAGPAGLGTLKAAADSDKYAIGVDSNQNGIHPDNVLASMVKQIGNSIYNSVEQIKAGEAEFGKVKVFGLEDEGVALMYNDTIVPEQVKAQIEAAETKVTSGEIEVDSAF
jgi:basic membrane protein A